MAKQLFKPSDLNQRIDFCTVQTVQNPKNGSQHKEQVVLFTKKGAQKTRTLNQQYTVQNTTLADTVVLAVRHDKRINKTLSVKWNDDKYDILDISSDGTNNTITYDFVTVKKVTK